MAYNAKMNAKYYFNPFIKIKNYMLHGSGSKATQTTEKTDDFYYSVGECITTKVDLGNGGQCELIEKYIDHARKAKFTLVLKGSNGYNSTASFNYSLDSEGISFYDAERSGFFDSVKPSELLTIYRSWFYNNVPRNY